MKFKCDKFGVYVEGDSYLPLFKNELVDIEVYFEVPEVLW